MATTAKIMPRIQTHKYAFKAIQMTIGLHGLQEEESSEKDSEQKPTLANRHKYIQINKATL